MVARRALTHPRRDRLLLLIALLGFALWLFAIGLARMWATRAGLGGHWTLGVAPSFFAGFTFALWQAYIVRSGPFESAASAAVLVSLAELVQLGLPRYRADSWDAVAGIAGAALTFPLLSWRMKGGK
jgi:hypothetical protein